MEAVVKKNASIKTRITLAAIAAVAAPERRNTAPQNYWPDEFKEILTKSEEYGQEMFLRLFDLFTTEIHAQLEQSHSKRRRRCVQNNNYQYGRVEHPTSSLYE